MSGSREKWKNLFEKKNSLSRLHSTSFMYANVYFPSLFFFDWSGEEALGIV